MGMGMERRRREEVHSGEGGVDAMTGNRVVWVARAKTGQQHRNSMCTAWDYSTGRRLRCRVGPQWKKS